jgi:hypothetical protein
MLLVILLVLSCSCPSAAGVCLVLHYSSRFLGDRRSRKIITSLFLDLTKAPLGVVLLVWLLCEAVDKGLTIRLVVAHSNFEMRPQNSVIENMEILPNR